MRLLCRVISQNMATFNPTRGIPSMDYCIDTMGLDDYYGEDGGSDQDRRHSGD
jgi:hypothetical protein